MSLLAAVVPVVDNEESDIFLTDVVEGLSKPQKTLPCKYFYDETGSQLFERICQTPEYYVTRTECDIYQSHGGHMSEFIGESALILEPGAGSVKKIALLLKHLQDPAGFIPMDISVEILHASSQQLAEQFPKLDILPMAADFLDNKSLKRFFSELPQHSTIKKRVIFFPGSTIGNLHPSDARAFLGRFADNLESGDGMLIGVDLVKDQQLLELAYNDQAGVTADFNLNLLHRINNELDADLNIDSFSHKAIFNKTDSRIEMHLVSNEHQKIRLGGRQFTIAENETIHTENSYKYTFDTFRDLVTTAGFESQEVWTDSQQLFSVHYLRVI